MLILHGENEVASRQQLAMEISTAKMRGDEISRYAASDLSYGRLESALTAQSLFERAELLVIEELHSLPRSKKKTELVKLIAQYQDDQRLLLWEKKTITASQLKQFPRATVRLFKTSSAVFSWLDSLGARATLARQLELLRLASTADGAELCFLMLARQTRLLIQSKAGANPAGPPFVQAKLRSQAQQFSLEQLHTLHSRLLDIDIKQKTGRSPFTLAQELDLTVINLYST